MSNELSVEELALQETQKAVEAEAAAKAEADAKQWGDQSNAAKAEAEIKALADAKAKEEAAAIDPAAVEAKAKADAEAAAQAAAQKAEDDKAHDPHAAIVAFRKQNQILLAEKLRLEGMVHALQSVAQPATPAAKAVETDPLDVIAAKRVALAEQADAGELTLAEMRRQDMAFEREAREIEFSRLVAQQQAQFTPKAEPDLSLEMATQKLASDYPVLNELSVADLAPFRDLAYAQAEREGSPIQPGALGTLELRTRMAKLATKMYGVEASPAAAAKPAAAEDSQAARASAALAAKVDMQNGMPPDATKLGTGNTDPGMTEAQITQRLMDPNLTYEESAKLVAGLSPALRAKLGI